VNILIKTSLLHSGGWARDEEGGTPWWERRFSLNNQDHVSVLVTSLRSPNSIPWVITVSSWWLTKGSTSRPEQGVSSWVFTLFCTTAPSPRKDGCQPLTFWNSSCFPPAPSLRLWFSHHLSPKQSLCWDYTWACRCLHISRPPPGWILTRTPLCVVGITEASTCQRLHLI
jgi:hypothetical protein